MFGLHVFLVLTYFVRVLVLRGEIYIKASCNIYNFNVFNLTKFMLIAYRTEHRGKYESRFYCIKDVQSR
jgi:hypothetical protein